MKRKPRMLNLILVFVFLFGTLGVLPIPNTLAQTTTVLINEVDADTLGTDVAEFVELYDGGVGNTALDGLVLVFFNGNGDISYAAYDLDGFSTDENGYFLVGNNGVIPEPSIIISTSSLQNGQDAVALYTGDAVDFTSGTPVTTTNLIDALVYDTNDDDDPGLLVLLNAGQLQVNEGGGGDSTLHSNQRCPNGSGGLRNTDTYIQFVPTPGNENCVSNISDPVVNEFSASTDGDDVEYVEIFGDPETDYSAYTVLEIEGDSTAPGVIDEVIEVGTTDVNGLYLASLINGNLENGSISLLLVKDFTGAFSDDLDTNDDGVLDVEPWAELVDSVAVNDGGIGDYTYGTTELYGNYDGVSTLPPGGASRFPDGFDTDAVTDWVRNDFDLAGIPGFAGTITEGEAYNTPGDPNEIYTPPAEVCGDPYTPIYTIQGSGLETTLSGEAHSTEGVVVGDYQDTTRYGFFIQDLSGDSDASTSDGIFIYEPYGSDIIDVNVGDHVRISGTVSEYSGMTQISASQSWLCATGVTLPEPSELSLPVADALGFEKLEGMLVTIPQNLVIAEYFNFDRYGEIVLSTERYMTFTALNEPDFDAYQASIEEYFLNKITLDDGLTVQNPDPAIHPNGDEFTMDNLFRGGDLVANVTGVMDYAFSLYRIQPTQGADYTPMNDRPLAPDLVEGDLKVASFNVLNYFTTIDTGDWICGPSGDMECRGADTADELTRQRDKILAAMVEIDADVFGLMEIENDRLDAPTSDYAVADLVAGLNSIVGAGVYDYIPTGAIGTDAIKQAIIYKPAKVTPIGTFKALTSAYDTGFDDTKNRPTLAQVFEDPLTGEDFIVAVNHLKSKGSVCEGDPDLGDGAGNCNLTRLAAAEVMVDWLADPAIFPDVDNVLIIGDLNSYDKEDPIDAIKLGSDDLADTGDDYVDLIHQILGEEAYGYVFDGHIGYLDYALTNKAMEKAVIDVAVWHINADEPDLIDYDMSYKLDAQDALYAPDAYRSSDHDPVIVSLSFVEGPTFDLYLPIIFSP